MPSSAAAGHGKDTCNEKYFPRKLRGQRRAARWMIGAEGPLLVASSRSWTWRFQTTSCGRAALCPEHVTYFRGAIFGRARADWLRATDQGAAKVLSNARTMEFLKFQTRVSRWHLSNCQISNPHSRDTESGVPPYKDNTRRPRKRNGARGLHARCAGVRMPGP